MLNPLKRSSGPQTIDPNTELDALSEQMPWFGEDPFLPSVDRYPPRPVMDSPDYIRRVCISWLIGRPVSQIAKRVGCSPRTAQSVVRKVMYVPEDYLESGWASWCELGLIGAVDTPIDSTPGSGGAYRSDLESDPLVAVVCQVCHRVVGSVPFVIWERKHDGIPIDHEQLASGLYLSTEAAWRSLARVQGHLLCHFPLDKDPIPRRYRQRQHDLNIEFAKYGLISKREVMSSWRHHFSDSVSPDALGVLSEFVEKDPRSLLPVVDGKALTLEQARRRWRKMLR